MTTVHAYVSKAAKEIGNYYARPDTPSKYGVWYGLPKAPFCAMFISWVADQTKATDIIPKHAYTPKGAAWFKQEKRWHNGLKGVRRGDIVYFNFPGAPDRISHVGVVEKVLTPGKVVQTIEGNTSAKVGGSQRNGGAVARKIRTGAYIVGYGRPAYSAPSKVANRVYLKTLTRAAGRNGFGEWYGGRSVKNVQRAMGFKKEDIDGVWGNQTRAGWQHFQRSINMTPTGRPTRASLKRFAEKHGLIAIF